MIGIIDICFFQYFERCYWHDKISYGLLRNKVPRNDDGNRQAHNPQLRHCEETVG